MGCRVQPGRIALAPSTAFPYGWVRLTQTLEGGAGAAVVVLGTNRASCFWLGGLVAWCRPPPPSLSPFPPDPRLSPSPTSLTRVCPAGA